MRISDWSSDVCSSDLFDAREAETIARLKAIAPTDTGELNSGDKRCLVPLTVADLADLYDAYPQARLLAGGTALALEVTQFHRTLPVMIYVGQVAALKRTERFADGLGLDEHTSQLQYQLRHASTVIC